MMTKWERKAKNFMTHPTTLNYRFYLGNLIIYTTIGDVIISTNFDSDYRANTASGLPLQRAFPTELCKEIWVYALTNPCQANAGGIERLLADLKTLLQ